MGTRRSRLVCSLLLVGCGRVGFDDVNGDGSTGGGDGGPGDGGSDGSIDAALTCPNGYVSVPNETSKYKAVDISTSWLPAEQACEAEGTHLWIPDSTNERTQVIALKPITNLWTGVTDRKMVGQWLRVTGGVTTFLPWEASGEPDLAGLECIQVDSVMGLFGDQDCGSGRRYVCECDGAAAMPSTY